MHLDEFNRAPDAALRPDLLTCCGSEEWVSAVLAGRHVDSQSRLLDLAELAVRQLSDAGLDQALAGHPRIGEWASTQGPEAALSRQEQSAVATAAEQTKVRLREANVAYEDVFDRVFLIRASGRSPEEILAEAERRLGNDPVTERAEVLEQLGEITRLRIEGYLHS